MREIKFRAWYNDGEMEFMSDPISINRDIGSWFEWDLQGCKSIMQYTGLKDRNGKEIYEGDIVEMAQDKKEIIFQDGGFGFRPSWYRKSEPDEAIIGFAGHNALSEILGYIEVIGNIHENPELLDA